MNAEEKSILEKAKQNLEAAELLLDQGFYEIAISRGYYALFLHNRGFAVKTWLALL